MLTWVGQWGGGGFTQDYQVVGKELCWTKKRKQGPLSVFGEWCPGGIITFSLILWLSSDRADSGLMCRSPCHGVGNCKPQDHMPLLGLWWEGQRLVVLGTDTWSVKGRCRSRRENTHPSDALGLPGPTPTGSWVSPRAIWGVCDWLSLVSPPPGAAGQEGDSRSCSSD